MSMSWCAISLSHMCRTCVLSFTTKCSSTLQLMKYLSAPCVTDSTCFHFNRFEKLDTTPESAQNIKPVLERWMKEAEERLVQEWSESFDRLHCRLTVQEEKKSFAPQALELLNAHFERNTHPSGTNTR
ncbi:pou domain motif 3 [Carabus blaptoides fortunei]